jgi:hypothetical protein
VLAGVSQLIYLGDAMGIAFSRRQFLWTASAGVLAAGTGLPGLIWKRWQLDEATAAVRPRFFTHPKAFATLEALVDRIIPPDADPLTGMPSPGAKAAGVADYIDFLLGAFLSSKPFIFAGGPFSDRNPVGGQGLTDDMARPIALTPWQRLAWRIRILGTKRAATTSLDAARIEIVKANNVLAGIGDTDGDLLGFQHQYTEGIEALQAAALAMSAKDFFALTTAEQDEPIGKADPVFIALVTNHTAEGMYGNPEYGGNQPPDRTRRATGADGDNRPIGWTIANFEGDRQPMGYTSFDAATQTIIEEPNHPVSTPDPGDPTYLDPKTAAMVRQLARGLRNLHPRTKG